MPVRGRFAPSPTGAQHLGNARTYLAAWLAARHAGGEILLRIEDIDTSRLKPGAIEQAVEDLHWLGFDWDGEPIIQTTRSDHHHAALAHLIAQNAVYPCTCSRADIAAAQSAPHAEDAAPVYPGTCRNRTASDAQTITRPYAWRFRLPAQTPEFQDEFLGTIRHDLHTDGGDFVVAKSVGGPAYQLAVVVDDGQSGITHVVRADDLVGSTPRQLLLYDALELPAPRFAHLPLVLGEDGKRLAKRQDSIRLATLRDAGVRPTAILGYLAWSLGWLARPEPITLAELIPNFTWVTVPRTPFTVTAEHLRDLGYNASTKSSQPTQEPMP